MYTIAKVTGYIRVYVHVYTSGHNGFINICYPLYKHVLLMYTIAKVTGHRIYMCVYVYVCMCLIHDCYLYYCVLLFMS